MVSRRYPNFTIVVSDKKPPQCTDDGLPIYTKFLCHRPEAQLPFYLKRQTCTDPQNGMWITESHHATCGVFLCAISLSKDPQQQTVYALTAGHSLLSNEQCKRLVKGDWDVKKSVWEEAVGKIGTACRLSVAPHGYPPFEICGTPLINLRHYVPADDSHLEWYEKFIADETMLEMTHDQLIQKGWTDDELQAYTECTPVRGGPT